MDLQKKLVSLKFSDISNKGWAIGSHLPEKSGSYSKFIQFGFNKLNEEHIDEKPHYHTKSEEYFIILKGEARIKVEEEIITVGPQEILGIKPNVIHQYLGGKCPLEEFVIRTPSIEDKVVIN